VSLADRFEEFDAGPSGHLVVRDHTVDAAVGDSVESLAGTGRRLDSEPFSSRCRKVAVSSANSGSSSTCRT
jgi:hypothetical protein